jgi:hypothetical protein
MTSPHTRRPDALWTVVVGMAVYGLLFAAFVVGMY